MICQIDYFVYGNNFERLVFGVVSNKLFYFLRIPYCS